MGNGVDRRRVLQGGSAGTIGITSLVLPGAAAAASGFWWADSTGLTAPTYSGGDALLAEWSYTNSSADRFFNEFSTQPASYEVGNVTGSLELRKGTGGTYGSSVPGSGDSPEGSLYATSTAGAIAFVAAETSTSVRVADGPCLRLRVFVSSGFNIDPKALVFSSAASDARISVRSDADGYDTSLRDFATPDLEDRNVVVNLEGMAAFGNGSEREFRIYPYATGTENGGGPDNRSLFAFRGGVSRGAPRSPLIDVLDTYNSRQDSLTTGLTNNCAVIGLIGQLVNA